MGMLRAPTTACRALTGLPSRYTRKSVSLTPEKRRPCGAEDTEWVQGSASPRGGRRATFHRQGAWAGGSERPPSP